jgi:vacuolar-type H+-ATPase subunit I/STV1
MPGKGSSAGGAEARPGDDLAGAQNNIMPFGLRTQRRLIQQLEFEQKRLSDLAAQVKERDKPKVKDILADLQKTVNEASDFASQITDRYRKEDVERLNRLLKGRLQRTDARLAAIDKRLFEINHPRRLIRMPKGTSQIEFANAMKRINAGDKAALREFTVPRPKGFKTASERSWARKQNNNKS